MFTLFMRNQPTNELLLVVKNPHFSCNFEKADKCGVCDCDSQTVTHSVPDQAYEGHMPVRGVQYIGCI